jgi:hypothetical protein
MSTMRVRVRDIATRDTRYIRPVGVMLGAAVAVALLGFGAANLLSSAARHSHARVEVPTAARRANTVAAQPAMMEIVPARANDTGPGFLVGTGDGSNGAWVRR